MIYLIRVYQIYTTLVYQSPLVQLLEEAAQNEKLPEDGEKQKTWNLYNFYFLVKH